MSPSVNLTVTSQTLSLRSDDGDTRGRLKASFPRVTATTTASMRYNDFERKECCVYDTIHYDTDLQTHWWRTIDFLIRVGQAGIVLNAEKFHFEQRIVDFAGFRISDETIEPLPKYMDAIRDFPTPTSTTDIRSWFGLVNQVTNYAQLRDIMAPFKPFLSPNLRPNDTNLYTPRLVSSRYFLSPKHCSCDSCLPDRCTDGCRVTLAGSRFFTSAEQRYAPTEGEALDVAWGLEQSKYFTQGCNDLLVVTDHKPLVKILGDRTLDEISNTRIFRLKQRTLPWSFNIAHLPGKTNSAAYATPRYPSPANEFAELRSLVISLHSEMDDAESSMAASLRRETRDTIAISWERIATETASDPTMRLYSWTLFKRASQMIAVPRTMISPCRER